jgi:3D (Asp-Asp-Asp) domain-containing protein
MRWDGIVGRLLGLAAMFLVGFSLIWYGSGSLRPLPPPPASHDEGFVEHAPVFVSPDRRLAPIAVAPARRPPRAASRPSRAASTGVFDFDFGLDKPLILRRRLPVQITMYCLDGITRAGNVVRDGIIAADPRVLPLGTVVDVYVGLRYYGRFLVDDTGGVIKGPIIDVWTRSCADARKFGRRRGAVVLVDAAPPRRRR